jgi:hypothetical protein
MVVKIPKKLEMKSLLPAPRSRTSFSLLGHSVLIGLAISHIGNRGNTILKVNAFGAFHAISCLSIYTPRKYNTFSNFFMKA